MDEAPVLEFADETQATQRLASLHCTDGLPIVVPTVERVERMILASGLDGDTSLGAVPPRGGLATVEIVAANAVMAGCSSDHFPVLIAAVRAALDPMLDLAEMQATTNPVSPLIIVNGPARHSCGEIASGYGALGPGHPANACIGRALRLVLMNLGGARPNDGDMALLGHGGKFTACVAEGEETSPFEPLHVALGWDPLDSVVTVVGADAPQAVVLAPTHDLAASADRLLSLLALVLASPAHVGTYSSGGSDVVVFNPDHAALLHDAGYDRSTVAAVLAERSKIKVGRLRQHNPGVLSSAGSFHTLADEEFARTCDSRRLLIIVAGGAGAYSFVLRSWGVGPHKGASVTTRVELNASCAIVR